MEKRLTTDQKREYLRLLLSENAQAAGRYLDSLRPRQMVFHSKEELRNYERATGEKVTWWCIILNYPKPKQDVPI